MFEFASAIIGCSARNAPCGVEIVHCKCGIEMYPMTGVIIRCKRFGPHGKSAYTKLAIIIIIIIIIKPVQV